MFRILSKIMLGFSLIGLVILGYPAIAQAQLEPAQLAKVVQEIENMRSKLGERKKVQTYVCALRINHS